MQQVNILFLGGAKRVSMGEKFIAAGLKKGLEVRLFSYELNKYVPVSAIATIIVGKRWGDADVLDDLRKKIAEHQIHIIIPFVDPATVLSARLKELATDVFFPVPSAELCSIFFDKLKADEWFRANGFPVPVAEGSFPVIAKPALGSASQGIVIIWNKDELEDFCTSHDASKYLLQKFIDGIEYTVDCYVSIGGKILGIVPRRRLEVTAGEVTKTVTLRDEEIISITANILQKSGLTGPVTVQFIRDRNTHKLFVMEINPRFGGGCLAAIGAGADYTSMLLNDFVGLPNDAVNDWQENLLMMRAHREFFIHATDY